MTAFVPGGPPRYRHQKRGLLGIIRDKGVHALLFDPGTGKTATTLDYMSLLALKSPTGEARVLVVAPLAAIDTWVLQAPEYVADGIALWAEALGGTIRQRAEALASRGGNLPRKAPAARRGEGPRALHQRRSVALVSTRADGTPGDTARGPDGLGEGPRLVVCAVNLDAFNSRAPASKGSSQTVADLMVDAVRRFAPDLIVVDESHRIKGASSNTSRALARLTPLCRRRILLTGTVMPHSPLDVFGQWRFLRPEAFGEVQPDGTRRRATFGGFRGRFAKTGGWMGKEVIGFHRLDEMQEIMAENSTVARKSEVLDLPPVTEVTVPVHLSPTEAKAYAEMKDGLAALLADGTLATVGNRLTQGMRLRQITSGFIVDDNRALRVLGSSKAKVVHSIVHDTLRGESRVVVFAHFLHEVEALRQMLSVRGTEVVAITGSTPSEERLAIRKRFGSDDPARIVLVAQAKTLSLAVNELVTASNAVYASLSRERDTFVQSRDRLDRIGQTRPVTFWYALVPGSIDEVILKAHQTRTSLEDAVLAHIADG